MLKPASGNTMSLILCAGFVALLGCSKTQDTSPETRVFGDPPQIQQVSSTPNPFATASADFSNYFLASSGLCDDSPMLLGPMIVQSTYTEVLLEATVTDPDDPSPPSTGTDILLVSASYVTTSGGTNQEDTIVMFDDGSSVPFPFGQKDARGGGQECQGIVNNACACTKAFYDVTSNDPNAGDDVFTRNFAFAPTNSLPANMSGLYLDVIAKDRGQAAAAGADIAGATRDFRIEAVDRNGNLTESPTRPSVDIGTGSISCSGDPCACCLFLNQTNPSDDQADGGCKDLPGLLFDRSAPKRCEPFTDPATMRMRDPDKTYDLCTAHSDCCSPGSTCNTSDSSADFLTGSCIQSPFARRCFSGLCTARGCL